MLSRGRDPPSALQVGPGAFGSAIQADAELRLDASRRRTGDSPDPVQPDSALRRTVASDREVGPLSEPSGHAPRSHPVGWWVKLGAVTAFIVALTGLIGEVTGVWESIFGRSPISGPSTSEEGPSTDAPLPNNNGQNGQNSTEVSGCVVTVHHQFASIREEPHPFAQEIRQVQEGTYAVTDWTVVEFAGSNSRWLRIRVEDDQGWIEDTTMFIAARSSECDF